MSGDDWLTKLALVLLAGLVFAVTFAGVDWASRAIPPITLAAMRSLLASLIFVGLLAWRRPAFRWRRGVVVAIALVGALNTALPFVLLATALRYISATLAAVLFNITPAFTLFMAHATLPDEKLTLPRLAGAATAIAGATALILSNSSGLASGHPQAWIGQLLIVLASLTGAVAIIVVRLRLRGEDTAVLAGGQMFVTFAMVAPLALAVDGVPTVAHYPWPVWGGLLLCSIGAPVAGFLLLFHIVNRYSASLGGFAVIATPLFSAAIGLALLGEVLTRPMAVGTALLLAGIVLLSRF